MSTTYYTNEREKRPIGQTQALPKKQGYRFVWTMFPLEFATYATNALFHTAVIDEYDHELSMNAFTDLVEKAQIQTFEEGIE